MESLLKHHTHTPESQAAVTSSMAIQLLKEGNQRFLNNSPINRSFDEQVKLSSPTYNDQGTTF